MKAKYFFIGAKMRGVETEWRELLGDVTEAGRPVLRSLEVIRQILRLGGYFCGDHGASSPPPSGGLIIPFFVFNLCDRNNLQN